MNKSELKAQVKQTHHTAERSLRAFIKKGRQSKLHRFRTSVKKLRAIAWLVEQAAPAPHLGRTLRPLRKTFKLSGAIRDSYLHLELGKRFEATPGYLVGEHKTMRRATTDLHRNTRKRFDKLNQSKKKLRKALISVADLDLTLFYENELRAIEKQLAHPTNDDALHACRKRLKVLLYDLPLVRHVLDLPVNENYLEEVQIAIGDWHDNLLAVSNFPGLKKKTESMREAVNNLTKDIYTRATTPVELPLPQID